jgi:methionyl-tRNA synthetase
MTALEQRRLLITAALPYANGPLHIGHLAGAYLPADIFCRYQRMIGKEVVFICGSDEHGVPIQLRARAEGISPQHVVDRYHENIRRSFERVGISFDYYGRTSSPLHAEMAAEFFRKLWRDERFIVKSEEQLYDVEAKTFLADRLVRGTCPTCGNTDAYGDQCEQCGRTLSVRELINPRSAVTNTIPEERATSHWYLPLGQHQAWLTEWLAERKGWKANVIGQARSWLSTGLSDRAMTRDLSWGVPVPRDVATEAGVDPEGKVLYVWFDAPIGYISASREWAELRGQPNLWRTYWESPDTRLIHFIGKDNIVFHTIIFPIMLKLHGGYVLPENVPANEFLTIEGRKLSTSRNWAVWVDEVVDALPADYLRFYLTAIMPETQDADFSWQDFQTRVNAELADTFGNFVNRALAFTARYFDNKVPRLESPTAQDLEMLNAIEVTYASIGAAIDGYRFREACQLLMELLRKANKYFGDSAPWATRKTDPRACANTLHVCTQIVAASAVVAEPFLPHSAERLRHMVRLPQTVSSLPGSSGLSFAVNGALLPAGHELGTAEILFAKITDDVVQSGKTRLVEASNLSRAPV